MSKKSLPLPLQKLNEGNAALNGGEKSELLHSALNHQPDEPIENFFIEGNEESEDPITYGEALQWASETTFLIRDDDLAKKLLRASELQTSVKQTLLGLNAEYVGPEDKCPKSIKNVESVWSITNRNTGAPFTPSCDPSEFKYMDLHKEKKKKGVPQKKRAMSHGSGIKCAACGLPFCDKARLKRHHKNGSTRRMRGGVLYPACKNGKLTGSTSAYRRPR